MTPERCSLAARRAALLLTCTWEAPAQAAPHPQQPPARHTARVPPAEDRRLEASALATVRVLLVRGCSRRTRSPRARVRGEDHSERPPGEARREAGRVALRPPCAAVARPSTEQRSRRGPNSARSEGCGRPPSRRACGTGRSVAEACASKEPRPGAVESWSRARRRQAARAHAGCREPPSLAAQERG